MGRFDNARVLVTGGANGLGLGVTQRFVAEGATVWIADIDPDTEAIAAEHGAIGVVCDVSDSGQIDVAVANAGIGGGGPIVEMTDDGYRRIIAVNLDGVYFTCRAAARVMLPVGSGVIVTVGSVFGQDTPAGSSAYGAAKAGVVAITIPSPGSSPRTGSGSIASAPATWTRSSTGPRCNGGPTGAASPSRR